MRNRTNPSMLKAILGRFSEAKILVVGDIMMDRFIWGKVSRISPEAPVPVVLVERETLLLGGAANVVNNIHSLGGHVSLCGVIGDDEGGQRVLRELTQRGVDIRGLVIEEGRQTTTKTRIIAHQQQVVRIDRETTDFLKSSTFRDLSRFIDENIRDCDGIILSDYGKGLLTRELIRALIRRASETKKFVMVDPKLKNFFFYRGATVITPNTGEASAAAGVPITDLSSLKRVGKALLKRLRCEVLVITRGEEGMALFEPNQEPYLVPTVAREVYDVTGAGDTVIGTMALAMAAGVRVRDAARLANHAAGIVVGKVGTATVTQEELAREIRRNF
ncbi:MAG TPA: D-glycero-beta-D-manno-heptose-7-phosphate kinase [Thermodesulfobacteriota bacterium]|nr:D-glycero-beta-D-manno-heptose-7-phosphate kinase [Thermodesulfobacteriota bacterium]